MARQAGPVAQQIPQGDVSIRQRIAQAKGRQIPAHRVVPVQLAFFDQQGQRRRGERLGAGSQGKERVGRDRIGGCERAQAVALEINNLSLVNDADRDAGDLPGLEGVADGGIDGCGLQRPGLLARAAGVKGEEGQGRKAHGNTHTREFPMRLVQASFMLTVT